MSEVSKIALSWNLSIWEPRLKNLNEFVICQEILHPEDFLNSHYAEEYWSPPERLMHMRWISERARYGTEGLQPDLEQAYSDILPNLYIVTDQIKNWISEWQKSIDQLEVIRKKNLKFAEYWDKYIAHISFWQLVSEYSLLDSTQLDTISKAVSDIQTLYEAHKKVDSRSIQTSIKTYYEVIAGRQDEAKLYAIRSFAHNAQEYLNRIKNAIFRAEKCGHSMDTLVENIKGFIDEETRTTADIGLDTLQISSTYRMVTFHLLQTGVNCLCDKLNNIQVDSIQDLTESFKKVIAELTKKMSDKDLKELLKKYTTRGRCIALMEFEDEKYMAFSSFFDCIDDEIKNWFGLKDNSPILQYFTYISKHCYGSILVCTDTKTARKMTGFTLGSNFELQETKNLYDVAKSELGFLSPDPPVENLEKLRGNIKGAFSCCERKLIAYQKVYNPVQPDSNSKRKVILYVSKQPCLNCYLALDKWIVNDKISLTIDYPEQHNATYLHN